MGTNQSAISCINITTIKYFNKRANIYIFIESFNHFELHVYAVWISSLFIFFSYFIIALEFKYSMLLTICVVMSVDFDVNYQHSTTAQIKIKSSIDTKRYLLIKVLQHKNSVNSNGKKRIALMTKNEKKMNCA